MKSDGKPFADPLLVLREEFDDWAILFDPDKGESFGLNPVSVFVFKRLDGKHTIQEIMQELSAECSDAPEDAEKYVNDFVDDLLARGLAGYEFLPEAGAL